MNSNSLITSFFAPRKGQQQQQQAHVRVVQQQQQQQQLQSQHSLPSAAPILAKRSLGSGVGDRSFSSSPSPSAHNGIAAPFQRQEESLTINRAREEEEEEAVSRLSGNGVNIEWLTSDTRNETEPAAKRPRVQAVSSTTFYGGSLTDQGGDSTKNSIPKRSPNKHTSSASVGIPRSNFVGTYEVNDNGSPHDHVLLPCAPSNSGKWRKIQACMQNADAVRTVEGLADTIFAYNEAWRGKWDFGSLYDLLGDNRQRLMRSDSAELEPSDSLDQHIIPPDASTFWTVVWPFITEMVMRTPELLGRGKIRLLRSGQQGTLLFSQEQVACILSNSFLCTWPARNWQNAKSGFNNFPSINFAPGILCYPKERRKRSCQVEKLRCLCSYFAAVARVMPSGNISIHRRVVPLHAIPDITTSFAALPDVRIFTEGSIEDAATSPQYHGDQAVAEIDFANASIGGGVIGSGCVQEEIRFLISPECIISRLICERMEENECIVLRGVRRYCKHSGYSDTFKYEGTFADAPLSTLAESARQLDSNGRSSTQIIAIDAKRYHHRTQQYNMSDILREVRKAFVGFVANAPNQAPVLATGNWGAGAFNGDPELKFVIQMIAAGICQRKLIYFTWGDKALAKRCSEWKAVMQSHGITSGQVWLALQNFCSAVHGKPTAKDACQRGVLSWTLSYCTRNFSANGAIETDE